MKQKSIFITFFSWVSSHYFFRSQGWFIFVRQIRSMRHSFIYFFLWFFFLVFFMFSDICVNDNEWVLRMSEMTLLSLAINIIIYMGIVDLFTNNDNNKLPLLMFWCRIFFFVQKKKILIRTQWLAISYRNVVITIILWRI